MLDELQDSQPEWVQAMLSRLRTNGRAVLLEDPEPLLYADRASFDIPEAVTVSSNENFRTPRNLVNLINALRLTTNEVVAFSPHEANFPDPSACESNERGAPSTVQGGERCLGMGFGLEEIAIVRMRGRERSVLQGLDRLGSWTLRRFTGKYDEGGSALWTQGNLQIDSVRRFKGQAALAVVLTECDLPQLDPINRRLLFVGLTRAHMHLEWVMSKATATLLEQKFR